MEIYLYIIYVCCIVIVIGFYLFLLFIEGLKEIFYFINEMFFLNWILLDYLIIVGGGLIGMEMV